MPEIVQEGRHADGHIPGSKRRLRILFLISGAVLLNYLDRAVISIAGPAIQSEFELDAAVMGIVYSAFSWSYFLAQVPAGLLLDRLNTRLIYFFAIIGWSLATAGHVFATGLGTLVLARIALGLAESPCFPANSSIIAKWFPTAERSRAISVYTAAEYVGIGFLGPILFWILNEYGWRMLFASTGSIGIVFAYVWLRGYLDPWEDKRLSDTERQILVTGGAFVDAPLEKQSFSFADISELASHRQIWGLCLGQFAVFSTLSFFLTWFPTYLSVERHMNWIKVGAYSTVPFIAGFLGILCAGFWSDQMLKRGWSLNAARKIPVITGLIGAGIIIIANYTESDAVAIAIITVAFFAQAMASSGWAVISEVAREDQIGLVGGLFSASANFAAILTPLAVGFIVSATGSFSAALVLVGAIALAGAMAWIFMIGDIKRMSPRPT